MRSTELVLHGRMSGVHNVRGCAEEPLATRGLQIAGRDAARDRDQARDQRGDVRWHPITQGPKHNNEYFVLCAISYGRAASAVVPMRRHTSPVALSDP